MKSDSLRRSKLREKTAAARVGRKDYQLTTPDLVLLSLLAERPMHGYQANAELERRQVRDWASISRPQVYYSLEKLARLRLLRGERSRAPAEGPQRQVLATTAKGRAALAAALQRQDWTNQRERPAFLTWLALSWQARSKVVEQQMQRRRTFLEQELVRETEVLASIYQEVGHGYHEAVWMVSLVIEQFKTELRWLEKLERELPQREKARHPAYATDAENRARQPQGNSSDGGALE